MPTTFDKDNLKHIEQRENQWREGSYRSDQERLERFETLSGLSIDPLYTPAHIQDLD